SRCPQGRARGRSRTCRATRERRILRSAERPGSRRAARPGRLHQLSWAPPARILRTFSSESETENQMGVLLTPIIAKETITLDTLRGRRLAARAQAEQLHV